MNCVVQLKLNWSPPGDSFFQFPFRSNLELITTSFWDDSEEYYFAFRVENIAKFYWKALKYEALQKHISSPVLRENYKTFQIHIYETHFREHFPSDESKNILQPKWSDAMQ